MSVMFKISTITKLISEIDEHWRKELYVFDSIRIDYHSERPDILDKCIKELEDLQKLQKLNYVKQTEEEIKAFQTNPCIKCKDRTGHINVDEDEDLEIKTDGEFEIKIDEDLGIKMCRDCYCDWVNINRPRPKKKVSIKDFIDPKNKKKMEQYRILR
jgi:hypothetical protein